MMSKNDVPDAITYHGPWGCGILSFKCLSGFIFST